MERRLVIFCVLAFGILLGYSWLMQVLYPTRRHPAPPGKQVAVGEAADKAKPAAGGRGERPRTAVEKPSGAKPAANVEKVPPAIKAAPSPKAGTMGHPRLGQRRRSVPNAGHVGQPGGCRGAQRVEQPALSRHRRSQRLPRPPGHGRARTRQRLSGAGRRTWHPRRRSETETGRPDHGRQREIHLGPAVARSLLAENQARADRETFRRSRGQGDGAVGQASPASAGSDQARGRRSPLHVVDLAAIRRAPNRRRRETERRESGGQGKAE